VKLQEGSFHQAGYTLEDFMHQVNISAKSHNYDYLLGRIEMEFKSKNRLVAASHK
jgi:hypothetical protein